MTYPTSEQLTAPAPVDAAAAPVGGLPLSRLRRGGVLLGASQVLGMGLGLLGTMVLVRVAEPPVVASYLLLIQSTVTVSLLLLLGLEQATLRFAPVSRGRGGGEATALLRRRLLGLQVSMWAVAVPLLAFAWPWISWRLDAPELAQATRCLIGIAVLASLGNLMDSYLRSFRMYSVSAPLTHVVPRALIVAGLVYLWLSGSVQTPWELLATIYAAALVLTLFCYAAALWSSTPAESSEPRAAHAPPGMRTILATTTAMGLRRAASVLFVSADLWILSWARPHEEVAINGIATRLIQVMAALPGIAHYLIPQEFALLYADGRRAEMERLARSTSTFLGMLSAAALAGLLLLGRPVLGLAFGDLYLQGWSVVLILAVGNFWDTASGSAGYVLQMTGHHVHLLLLTAGAAALNVALSVLVVPRWGGHGVALATTVTLIAFNVAMVASAKRLVGVRTFVYLQPAQWRQVLRLLVRGEKPL